MPPKILIPMADSGHDPTETAVPFTTFKTAGFTVTFATETGNPPACDPKMYSGLTQKLLGADRAAVAKHEAMQKDSAYLHPLSWTDPSFDIMDYDVVFLPGGHEKGVRQIIESASLHKHLATYVPRTLRTPSSSSPNSRPKILAAICHGVQVLAAAPSASDSNRSVIHDFETTALPGAMETGIFWATRAWLGDYYKTYGAGSASVEEIVKGRLDEPGQWKGGLGLSPFVHEDPRYWYVSGRFPPDAEMLAGRVVEMVREVGV